MNDFVLYQIAERSVNVEVSGNPAETGRKEGFEITIKSLWWPQKGTKGAKINMLPFAILPLRCGTLPFFLYDNELHTG